MAAGSTCVGGGGCERRMRQRIGRYLGCEEEEEGKAGRGEGRGDDYNCGCYLELELWSGVEICV
jgi:hypothetical protein